MITAQQSRDYSADCLTLGIKPNRSVQRSTVLLAMSRSWIALANQKGIGTTPLSSGKTNRAPQWRLRSNSASPTPMTAGIRHAANVLPPP